jgi:hypothetical protein
MGLFSRKSSKPSATTGDSSSITSNGSLKSPGFPPKANGSSKPMMPPVMDVAMPPAPDPALDPAAYLRSIYAVRERCRFVHEKAKRNQLRHFNVDMSKFSETAAYVVSIIKVSIRPAARGVVGEADRGGFFA